MQTPYATTFPASQMDTMPILSGGAGVGCAFGFHDQSSHVLDDQKDLSTTYHHLGEAAHTSSYNAGLRTRGSPRDINPPCIIFENLPEASGPTVSFEYGANGDELFSNFHYAFQHNQRFGSPYGHENNAYESFTYLDSMNVDTRRSSFHHPVPFPNLVAASATPGTIVAHSPRLQEQFETASNSFDSAPETFSYEDGANGVHSILGTTGTPLTNPWREYHTSNAQLLISPSVDGRSTTNLVSRATIDSNHRSSRTMKVMSTSAGAKQAGRTAGNSLSKISKTRSEGGFKCHWRGCPSNHSFGRLADLKRHVETFHTAPVTYTCNQGGCMRMFRRKDKLHEHMRKIHLAM